MRDSLNSPPLRALGMGMGQLLLSLRPTRVEDSGGVMGEVLSSSQKWLPVTFPGWEWNLNRVRNYQQDQYSAKQNHNCPFQWIIRQRKQTGQVRMTYQSRYKLFLIFDSPHEIRPLIQNNTSGIAHVDGFLPCLYPHERSALLGYFTKQSSQEWAMSCWTSLLINQDFPQNTRFSADLAKKLPQLSTPFLFFSLLSTAYLKTFFMRPWIESVVFVFLELGRKLRSSTSVLELSKNSRVSAREKSVNQRWGGNEYSDHFGEIWFLASQ